METKDSDYPDASIFKCLFMLKIRFSLARLSLHTTFAVNLTYTSEPPPAQSQTLQTCLQSSGVLLSEPVRLGLRLKTPNKPNPELT